MPELLVEDHLFWYGLLRPGADGAPKPNLAHRWEYSDDGLLWTFHMRDDVYWHDGPAVTAHDAAHTFGLLTDPDYFEPRAVDYAVIKGIEAVDDFTLELRLHEPWAPLLQSLMVPLLPRHLYANIPPARLLEADFNRAPVGYGPYRLTGFVEGRYAVLEANTGFWGEGPLAARVEVHRFPDYDALLKALEDGTIDAAGPFPAGRGGVSPLRLEGARRRLAGTHTFTEYAAGEYAYIGLKHDHPLFRDVRVRRALLHAVNREEIIAKVLGGYGLPANSHYGPASWAYHSRIDPYPYDPRRAAGLLEAAGFAGDGAGGPLRSADGTPFVFTVAAPRDDKEMEQVLTMVAADFAAVGVSMEVEFHPWEDFIGIVTRGDFEAYASGFELGPDPDAHAFFHSLGADAAAYGPGLSFNDTGYAHDEADELLSSGLTALDLDERRSIYSDLHRHINSQLPLLFLYSPTRVAVTSDQISEAEAAAWGPAFRHLWQVAP